MGLLLLAMRVLLLLLGMEILNMQLIDQIPRRGGR